MQQHEVLVKPIVTERATDLTEKYNQFAFKVNPTANKPQIRDAIESMYGVKVTNIRTMVVPGKLRRRGMSIGKQSNWKKAIVTLKEGDVIDFYAAE